MRVRAEVFNTFFFNHGKSYSILRLTFSLTGLMQYLFFYNQVVNNKYCVPVNILK